MKGDQRQEGGLSDAAVDRIVLRRDQSLMRRECAYGTMVFLGPGGGRSEHGTTDRSGPVPLTHASQTAGTRTPHGRDFIPTVDVSEASRRELNGFSRRAWRKAIGPAQAGDGRKGRRGARSRAVTPAPWPANRDGAPGRGRLLDALRDRTTPLLRFDTAADHLATGLAHRRTRQDQRHRGQANNRLIRALAVCRRLACRTSAWALK